MGNFLGVKNFDTYQHYKERNISSWVKLYYKILDNYEIAKLTDAERWVFVGLLLLAGKCNNRIPYDLKFIGEKVSHENDRANLQKTIEKLIGFELLFAKSIDDKKQQSFALSMPIREDKNREEENNINAGAGADAGAGASPEPQKEKKENFYASILEFWNEQGIVKHNAVNDKITRKVDARLNEGYTVDDICRSIENYSLIVQGREYYFKYKWTLWDFLQRGFEKFKDFEIAQANYKKSGISLAQLPARKGKYSDLGQA